MTELWSTGAAITESLIAYAYVALGIIVLGFVLLEALYLLGLAALLVRWRPPRASAPAAGDVAPHEYAADAE